MGFEFLGAALVVAQAGFIDSAGLQILLAVVASGSLGVLITQLFRKDNTEADTGKIAGEAAAIALKSLREELKEALLLSEARRLTIEKLDRKVDRLTRNARRHRIWDLEMAAELHKVTGAEYPKPPELLDEPEDES